MNNKAVSVPTKEEVEQYFRLQDKIKAHARAVSETCTEICDCEEMEYITDDDDGSVTVGVWSHNCGHDSYRFPKEYLSMSLEAIKQRIEDKRREEQERRRLAQEKAKAKREANKAKREAAKLEKECKEYERLKEKFEPYNAEKNNEGAEKLGHWGFLAYDEACCSKCGHVISLPFYSTKEAKEKWNTDLPNYCEECGTKMEKQED